MWYGTIGYLLSLWESLRSVYLHALRQYQYFNLCLWAGRRSGGKQVSLNSDRVDRLLKIGYNIVTNPKWAPHDGKTFCNMAVCSAAVAFDYDGFLDKELQPMLADDIIRKMASDPKHWKPSTAQDAWDNAILGELSIACYSAAPDGHVAVVAPGPKSWSVKWSAYCPPVFNVGKTMNLKPPYTMGENFAFLLRPNHYIYVP